MFMVKFKFGLFGLHFFSVYIFIRHSHTHVSCPLSLKRQSPLPHQCFSLVHGEESKRKEKVVGQEECESKFGKLR